MSLPILITGGSRTSRERSAREQACEHSSSFDIITLDTREAFGIDDVRKINGKLSLRPYESSYQTVIVLEAQNLTLEAQNSFLKTLEGPSESAKIILTAPTVESLLSTVASRCQKMQLPSEEEEVASWRQFEGFFQDSFYQRYASATTLDLDSWIAIWRKILRANFGIDNTPFVPIQEYRQQILNYVKLLCKAQSLIKRRASPKLLKTVILLEAPFASVKKRAVNNS